MTTSTLHKIRMFGERPSTIERGMNRLKTLAPVLAAMIGMGLPEVARAENPEPETVGVAESLGDAALATHVNGNEAIVQRAAECKAAYDAAVKLRQDTKGKKSIWLVVDTALGGSAVKDHVQLAHDGVDALKACFEGSGEHPRIAHIINGDSAETGVSLRPIDGTQLERLLIDADPAATEAGNALHRAITLDLERDDPTLKELRSVISPEGAKASLEDVDSVTLGYSASRATPGAHVWEFNGQLGFTRGDDTAFVARGSAGLSTILSPVEGGRTTVGVAAELMRNNGHLDAAAGTYLQTSLGAHRPDLVLSALVNPENGSLEFQSEMALRFTVTNLKTE